MKEQIELYVKQGVVFRFPWVFRLLFLGNENPTHFQSIFITGESYIIVLCASEALVLPLFFIFMYLVGLKLNMVNFDRTYKKIIKFIIPNLFN